MLTKPSRNESFKDCRLIEMIHLHDCVRGALKELLRKVDALVAATRDHDWDNVPSLERDISGRFKVISSVYKSHTLAEDEFIWPALKAKGCVKGGHLCTPDTASSSTSATDRERNLEQHAYEEDHEQEQKMFAEIDEHLSTLRKAVERNSSTRIVEIVHTVHERMQALSQHLSYHLEKEETHCLPIIMKHLTKEEINHIVGEIMGRRSADMVGQIMTMAVQNLQETERIEMVEFLKQALSETYFDRWLQMSGWTVQRKEEENVVAPNSKKRKEQTAPEKDTKRLKVKADDRCTNSEQGKWPAHINKDALSSAQLDKFIKAVSTNPALTSAQKRVVIQSLTDSVIKKNENRNLETKEQVESSEEAWNRKEVVI